MYVVLIDWVASEGAASDLGALLKSQAETTLREEPDCHVFDVLQDPEQPERFALYEVYTSRAAFDAHLKMPYFAPFDAKVAPITASKDIRFLTRI